MVNKFSELLRKFLFEEYQTGSIPPKWLEESLREVALFVFLQ